MKNGWYWIDTRWGCGGIYCKSDIVYICPPIFKKFKNKFVVELQKHYKLIFIAE